MCADYTAARSGCVGAFQSGTGTPYSTSGSWLQHGQRGGRGGGKPAAYLWGRTLTTADNAVAAGIDKTGSQENRAYLPLLCGCSAAVKPSKLVAYRQEGLSSLVYSLNEQLSENELSVEVGCRRHSHRINAKEP